jgi:transposase
MQPSPLGRFPERLAGCQEHQHAPDRRPESAFRQIAKLDPGILEHTRRAREIASLGHEVKLVPPAYVNPFVKRNKNDAVDAEAICEAPQRPSMRYAAIKTEAQQAAGMVFRTRDLLVRQRTELINAIRGHLTEFGWVAPKGPSHVTVLASLLEEGEETGASLPKAARAIFLVMTGQLEQLNEQVALLDKEIARRAREDEAAQRLMTIPLPHITNCPCNTRDSRDLFPGSKKDDRQSHKSKHLFCSHLAIKRQNRHGRQGTTDE